jgi:hypothetical protein
LRVACGGGRERCETNVDFSVCYFDAEGGEGFEIGDLRGFGGGLAGYEMALETDAIYFDAASFEGGDEVLGCGRFGASILDVVVVVVKLYRAVVESGCLKGDGDVFSADLGVF